MSTTSAVERARAAAARHKRDWNPREVMPECTAFIDHIRAVFGAPVAIRAVEAGKTVVWGKLTGGRAVVPVLDAIGGYRPEPKNAFKRATPKIAI